MKLKKYLTVLLFCIACLCVGFAFGCKQEEEPTFTVEFAASEHVKFVYGGEELASGKKEVKKDATVEFSLIVDYGYENPVVKSNGFTLVADDGKYSIVVTENTEIVATVSEDILDGEGSEDSPFRVASLKDLRNVADMVNSGYSAYILGYYELTNDIDCGGENLDVIGHFEDQNAFFAGNFNGAGYTISNFKIETSARTYVGLFGCVQAATDTDTGVVRNLNLKDFTVTANASSDSILSVGSIVAYAVGATVDNCSATDGTLYVYGYDEFAYYAFAGGAVGVQQSVTAQASDGSVVHYLCNTENVYTDVNIIASGYVYAAGGVVGYTFCSHERAPSSVINCYALGDVIGAIRAGGVVGWLSDYSSVANCYATGYVFATVTYNQEITVEEFFAYAGGIVGYADVGTAISDSFSTALTEANAFYAGCETDGIVAFCAPATVTANGAAVENCYSGNVDATSKNFIENSLHWTSADWNIVDGRLPELNNGTGSFTFTITFDYGNFAVNGKTSDSVEIETEGGYLPFSFYLGNAFNENLFADNSGNTNYVSYGYFFDADCQNKVPFGYIPTRDITLYVGFADYSAVEGTYEFTKDGRTVTLVLNSDGTYSYVDLRSYDGAIYTFDGEKLLFNDGLFARLANVTLTGANIANSGLYFEPYTFAGTLSGGVLSICDGTYITEANPLRFTNTSGTVKPAVNAFIGTWERSATLKETYTFNADGTWTYKWKGQEKSGTYTVSNGTAILSGGINTTASIDVSGLLSIGDKLYSLENSFFGLWYSSENGAYLRLNGYGTGLGGEAVVYVDGSVYDSILYVKDGFFDSYTGSTYTYTLLGGYSLFGYFSYDPDSRLVTLWLFDGEVFFGGYELYLIDDYNGEWIGESSLNGVAFTLVDFNGLGIYKAEIGNTTLGYVEINGERVPYECSIENGLEGKFTYKGVEYTLSVNDDGTVSVKSGSSGVILSRKDEMYTLPLVDAQGTVYEFNGGGNLSGGGVLTVGDNTYAYKIAGGTVEGRDIVINLYENSGLSTVIGTVTVSGDKFIFRLNGEDAVSLDLYLTFAGRTWAINAMMNTFNIGKFDLTYTTTGSFNNIDGVNYRYYPEYNYIEVWNYDYFDSSNSFFIYLLILNDDNIAVSSYPYLVYGDYLYASPMDDLFGSWINTVDGYELMFDGLADSMYTTGVAFDSYNGITYFYTRRFGNVYMWRVDDENTAYLVEHIEDLTEGENIFLKSGSNRFNRISLTETDILNASIFTANCGDVVYNFNFDGTLTVGGEDGTYLIDNVNGDETTLLVEVDGEQYVVIVNHVNGTVKLV